jgi:quinoprotein glucose dehydrogenase
MRLFYVAGTKLFALDSETGQPISSFGSGGSIDLREGLDREMSGFSAGASSPGIVFEDLIIQGTSIPDWTGTSGPGHIRAFNVRTGEREWIFHTIPHPGEFGYETWPPDAWQTASGANAWAGLSLDVKRGIVFAPTGSPTYDHNGFNRHGTNLFANSVLALNARTGERIWHFQAVHHDLWDYDLASPPNLVTVRHEGVVRDAVAQVTKIGHLFLLDRQTGEPLFPVEERPVPQSTIPGEQSWPTQPFPTKPPAYARQGFSEADITDLSPEAHDHVKKTYFDKWGPAVLFPPPGTKGSFVVPQFNGGTDWGGAAFDSASGMLYVSASNEPEAFSMLPAPETANHPYEWIASGHDELFDAEGFPVSKRPWGTLNAIDLNEGTILWQVPLGTYPELEARGLPPTGTFNMGGPVATAGGLVFIGGSKDERFRAFDKDTGEVLWEYQLPAGGYATPSVYMVKGKQYVVIAAGGGGKPGTKPGDSYVAFALP